MKTRNKTVLVVVAHADDMEFLAGGTVARFVDEFGYSVYEYILTDNRRGSFCLPPEELVAVSAAEAVAAGAFLGLKEVRFGGYFDGQLDETPQARLRNEIISVIREIRADILMTWDPFAPYEDHPDHRTTAMAALEAAAFSGNPCFAPECGFSPHPVTEGYFFAKSPWNAELFVDISATIDQKIEALLLHDCQMQLTLDALRQEARVLGTTFPMCEQTDPLSTRALVDLGVRSFCAQAGAAKGLSYAEQFRYQKFAMLDTVFGMNLIQCDFSGAA